MGKHMDACGFLPSPFYVKRGQCGFIGFLFSHRSHPVCQECFFKPVLCRFWLSTFNSSFHHNPRLCSRKGGFLWYCTSIMEFSVCKCNMDRQVSFSDNDIPLADTRIHGCFNIPVFCFIEFATAK